VSRPPGPRTFRMLWRMARARGNTPVVLAGIARDFGDVAYWRIGPAGFWQLSRPDLVKEVLETQDQRFERIPGERRVSGRLLHRALFASEGDLHARQRTLMEPVMYGRAAQAHLANVVEHVERMIRSWRYGETVDVHDGVERASVALMVKVLFGEDAADGRGQAIARALVGTIDTLNALPLGPTSIPDRMPVPRRGRFRRQVATLRRLVDEVVAERKAAGASGDDVVSLLLRARDEDGRGMSEAQVRDEAIGLYRGQQGVPSALSWTWYLLSGHPEEEARFHREIDEVLGGRPPGWEDLPQLPYTRMVFREALRLYPPAWVLARRAVADHRVDGHVIPAGAKLVVSEWVLHRDPRFWVNPDRFDPERFRPDRMEEIPQYAYFPQGAGPKRCMGMEFLPVEAVTVLALVGQRWRLRVAPGHRVEPQPKVTLKPRGGMPMVLEHRPSE
jgi:cytochrome P450